MIEFKTNPKTETIEVWKNGKKIGTMESTGSKTKMTAGRKERKNNG